MQSFKTLLILIGLMFVSLETNAQIVNGDFASGPVSWQWSKSQGSSVCGPLVAFTPSVTNETPFLNDIYYGFSTRFGRIANLSGENPFYEDSGTSCKEIVQEVNLSIGQELQFEMWTNAGKTSSACIGCRYAAASVEVVVRDTESSLIGVYQPSLISGPACNSSTCEDFTTYGIKSLNAFWGKRVKVSIKIGTSFRRGVAGGRHLYPANILVDNIKLEKRGIASTLPKTGAWYNPDRSGHGLHLSKTSDNRYQLIWYTYLSNGKPIWYISDVASMINGVLTAKIYKSTWNYTTQTNSSVVAGDIKLEMHFNDQLTFSWDLYSVNGDNVGYDGGEPMFHLLGQGSYTGLWYEPALSGYGYSIDHRNSDNYTATTAFYYINGEPVWARGEKASAPTGNNITALVSIKGLGLCPECNGQPITKTTEPVGEVGLSLDVNKSWVYLQDAAGVPVWQRGLPQQPVDTYRLTYP